MNPDGSLFLNIPFPDGSFLLIRSFSVDFGGVLYVLASCYLFHAAPPATVAIMAASSVNVHVTENPDGSVHVEGYQGAPSAPNAFTCDLSPDQSQVSYTLKGGKAVTIAGAAAIASANTVQTDPNKVGLS